MINKKAQIWVETVLYTVVILSIIAIVLSFAIPKIDQGRDRLIIEQSIGALKNLDETIYDAARQNGNIRVIEFSLKRGTLDFDMAHNNITLHIQGLKSIYSEPNETIKDGDVLIKSVEGQKTNEIYLTISYQNSIDLKFEGQDNLVSLPSASLPYTFSIENINSVINITELR